MAKTSKPLAPQLKRRLRLLITIALVVQSLIFCYVGSQKSYYHMDEAYSFGLASYDKMEIHDNPDFYDTWHTSDYYADYLQVDDDERWDFRPVYDNQVVDVHPPFYYLLLRFTMELTHGRITKWGGIALNIVVYTFITVFAYLILQKLLPPPADPANPAAAFHRDLLALAIAFTSSLTLASLIDLAYIRMYALSALNVLAITYFHLRLQESYDRRNLTFVALFALLGSLTHYFFLFYLAVLFACTLISRFRHKQPVAGYLVALAIAAALSLLIFPHSIHQLFFSYRGDGAISNLSSFSALGQIGVFLAILHRYAFNSLLLILALAIIVLFIILWHRHALKTLGLPSSFFLVLWPSLAYFLLTAIASPYLEVRYILPVCTPLFLLVFAVLYALVARTLPKPKPAILITLFALALTLLAPLATGDSPAQVLYPEKRAIVSALSGDLNLPTVYWYKTSNDRFLDDIYLFALLDHSYLAKDADPSPDLIKSILKDQDLSRGLILFINGDDSYDLTLAAFQSATDLTTVQHLEHLNACDVYLLTE